MPRAQASGSPSRSPISSPDRSNPASSFRCCENFSRRRNRSVSCIRPTASCRSSCARSSILRYRASGHALPKRKRVSQRADGSRRRDSFRPRLTPTQQALQAMGGMVIVMTRLLPLNQTWRQARQPSQRTARSRARPAMPPLGDQP